MTRYRVLLIGATGHLGRHFVSALRDQGHDVLLLMRPQLPIRQDADRGDLIHGFLELRAAIIEGDLADANSVETACEQVDAVISCVDHRPDSLRLQLQLASAAAKTGSIRRFIPSQFGIDSRTYQTARVEHGDVKRELQQVFDRCGLPVTYVHANGLASAWASSLGQLGLNEPPHGEVEVYGDGNTKFSIVAPRDVALYAVRALFDPQTENRHTSISPSENIVSQNELINIWEAKTDARLRRRTISPRDLDDRIAALAKEPEGRAQLATAQLVRAAWIDGLGSGRRSQDVIELTELYPDIPYQRIPEYLNRFVRR